MRKYSYKTGNRKDFSNVTLQLPVTELQELNELAYRFGRKRHSILYNAYRKGLQQVVANLEALAAKATPTDQGQR